MKISQKTQYGLRAMVHLAKKYHKLSPQSLKEIAKTEGIPFDYLEKIMATLEKAGVVAAKKGVQGGYYLARHPRRIKVGQIVRWLEGEMALVQCIATLEKFHCPQEKKCRTKGFWQKIQKALNTALNSLTLADLIKK